ncbi:hypothetical protein F5878DRAFT_707275 [Lentinula raphanica]|uniref:MYND-type domain-containing protein n=1 Tax=Lentinula raphanica TaxID=153919 RepID=A0AA38PHF0_9AGAR|nr:hypothetical protein F5880DRAFT_1194030 [Lentinula raphanica]KAJ3842728.1 hypothetical protein F5878DRAFT_707275 [Lentinula raphanica]
MEKTNTAPIRVLSESLLRPTLYSPTPNPSLFRYDPTLKIAIGGKNPVKICQYSVCPRRDTGYAGKKMKVCARCKHVRYCSKECQKADWAGHKLRGCRDFQYCNDYTGWMEQYKTVFTWAATEALQIHTTDNILHKVLRIIVTYADQIPAPLGPIPSPFYILSSKVIPLDGDQITAMLATPEERAESRAIRANGGAGRAILAIYFVDDPLDPKSTSMMKPLKIDLTDPLVPGYRHFDGWKSVLAGVVNGTISALDFGQNVGYQSSNANVQEVHEEVHADGKAEEQDALLD